jgi:hypothetical protein
MTRLSQRTGRAMKRDAARWVNQRSAVIVSDLNGSMIASNL